MGSRSAPVASSSSAPSSPRSSSRRVQRPLRANLGPPMETGELKARVTERVDARGAALDELAIRIHERPELAFEERFASSALADHLTREGAIVTRGAGGLETAYTAEIGSGAPVVAS